MSTHLDFRDDFFTDIMAYEPDANMVFNYLMVSALATVADMVERSGNKTNGSKYLLNRMYVGKSWYVGRVFCLLVVNDTRVCILLYTTLGAL